MDIRTATCRRCRATLRAPASVAAGIGPRCAAIEAAFGGLNDKQRDKALEVIADGGVARTSRPGVFRVVSSDGSSVHLCSLNGNCTCGWGLRRHTASAKTCYAVAAARLTARPRIRTAA